MGKGMCIVAGLQIRLPPAKYLIREGWIQREEWAELPANRTEHQQRQGVRRTVLATIRQWKVLIWSFVGGWGTGTGIFWVDPNSTFNKLEHGSWSYVYSTRQKKLWKFITHIQINFQYTKRKLSLISFHIQITYCKGGYGSCHQIRVRPHITGPDMVRSGTLIICLFPSN